jgi:hypothetical protein
MEYDCPLGNRSVLRFAPVRAIAMCAAFAAAGTAFSQVEVLERETLSAGALGVSESASLELNLIVVRIEGSGWTREAAIAMVREAGRILAQCGVALERARFETLAAPGSLDFSTPAARALARSHPVARPAVYLVRDTRSRPAFDAEAIGRGNSRTRPELADTVWVTAATRDPGVALAHELAHVLMDSGEHSGEEGNLMHAETSPGNRALSPAQCGRLRGTGRDHGLLRGRG